MESISVEKLAVLEAEYKAIDDGNKLRVNEIKVATNGPRLPVLFLSDFPAILSAYQNLQN